MPGWSRIAGVCVGMFGLWLLVYGVVIDLPVRRGYIPTAAGGFIALGTAGLIVWLGIRLTRQIPADHAARKPE
jgi:hypothetical protein